MTNPSIKCLNNLGQSVWLDNLTRGLIRSGNLKSLVDQGVTGVTTNPTIFYRALDKSSDYDSEIQIFATTQQSFFRKFADPDLPYIPTICDQLLVRDIIDAAEILKPIYIHSGSNDGFVSVEVDPAFSYRLPHMLNHARWLWRHINRPNILIKIPATPVGISAIRHLIAEGINVNATLVFSLEQYEGVAQAYLSGLHDRIGRGLPISTIRSVCSIFISRIDATIDAILDKLEAGNKKFKEIPVRGFAATANAQIAYDLQRIIFGDRSFKDLEQKGAVSQKLLWASTGVKDEKYEALKYVKDLVGSDTFITLPWDTLDALMKSSYKFLDVIDSDVDVAYDFMDEWLPDILEADGLTIKVVEAELLHEGIDVFMISFDELTSLLNTRLNKNT